MKVTDRSSSMTVAQKNSPPKEQRARIGATVAGGGVSHTCMCAAKSVQCDAAPMRAVFGSEEGVAGRTPWAGSKTEQEEGAGEVGK